MMISTTSIDWKLNAKIIHTTVITQLNKSRAFFNTHLTRGVIKIATKSTSTYNELAHLYTWFDDNGCYGDSGQSESASF